MQIGILGAGNIGATIGRLWVHAGHRVRFGTRHPERLARLTSHIGAGATFGTSREAAEYGEVVLLAVPLGSVPALALDVSDALAGKTVLDATNPYVRRDGQSALDALAQGQGSSHWTAGHFPGACMVKAFNMQRFDALQREAHHGEDPLAIILAGDDLTSIGIAKRLVHDAGFEAVVVGSLIEGRAFDPGTLHYGTNIRAAELRRDMADATSTLRWQGAPLGVRT